ncbi:MAG: hypothetical protein RLZZ519_2944 [Bacteroidota bacterium]|jgi:hypothetical protein
MKSETLAQAEWALEALLRGSVNEREALRDRLEDPNDASIDKTALLGMVMGQLNGDFEAQKMSALPKGSEKRATYYWLLTILGRLVKKDTESVQLLTKVVKSCNGDQNCDPKARYWALESLIKLEADELKEIARKILSDETPFLPQKPEKLDNGDDKGNTEEANAGGKPKEPKSNIVYSLAMAILSDEKSVQPTGISQFHGELIVAGLATNYGHRMAMRVLPYPDAIKEMCTWLNPNATGKPSDTDSLADAVQALAVLSTNHEHAEMAAEALDSFVRRARHHSWWNSLHAMALRGLRRFKYPDAVPILVEDLADPHPSILYEAAKALEATVGVKVATDRIVEVASSKPQSRIFRYANALRYMDRAEVANQLEHLMFTGELEMQETARNLLGELGGREAMDKLRNRTETMKAHREAIEKTEDDVKRLFDKSLEEARSGYTISTSMNFMLFLVGLAFMGVFLFLLMRDPDLKNNTVGKLIAGGGGAFVLIYNMFFAKTRDQVRESAEHLLGLKVIFLGYLRQLHQTDQAYVRRYLEDKSMTTTELKEYGDLISGTMQMALTQIKGNAKGSSDYNPPAQGGTTGGGPATV